MTDIPIISALHHVPAELRQTLWLNQPDRMPKNLRNDLRMIVDAEAAGWTVNFPSYNWHNSARFKKDDIIVWCTGLDYRRDRLVDGHYTGKAEIFPYDYYGLREALQLGA